MTPSREELLQRLESPSESKHVELKSWIEPSTPSGKAKIAKACMALRNADGGIVIIGIDDETRKPAPNTPKDIGTRFHPDVIQQIVSDYSSEPFDVKVEFVTKEGIEFPCILIEGGVKTPVVCKSNLADPNDPKKPLLKDNALYVRTAKSGRMSSSEIARSDWKELLETCFENREADIGRFIRRHLSGIHPIKAAEMAKAILSGVEEPKAPLKRVNELLNNGNGLFKSEVSDRKYELPDHGSFEVAVIIQPEVTGLDRNKMRYDVLSQNPRYSGWPFWIDSFTSPHEKWRPKAGKEESWNALIFAIGELAYNHIDFWFAKAAGEFYHYRALEDDLRSLTPRTVLDISIPVIRMAEAIAIVIDFATVMKVPKEGVIHCGFRWSGLKGREVATWADFNLFVSPGYKSSEDEFSKAISIPLDISKSAIHQFVYPVAKELFGLFYGFSLSSELTENIVTKFLSRKS